MLDGFPTFPPFPPLVFCHPFRDLASQSGRRRGLAQPLRGFRAAPQRLCARES